MCAPPRLSESFPLNLPLKQEKTAQYVEIMDEFADRCFIRIDDVSLTVSQRLDPAPMEPSVE